MTPMPMIEAITAFLAHYKATGRSPNTIDAYGRDLRALAVAVEGEGVVTVEAVTPELLTAYMEGIGAEGSTATQNRRMAAMLAFFAWCVETGRMEANPASGLERHTHKGVKFRTVAPDHLIRKTIERAHVGSRDRAVMELFALGITPTEVALLDLPAYDAAAGTLEVGARGQREARRVALSAAAICALDAYLDGERRTQDARQASPHMFPNTIGGRLTRHGLWGILSKHLPLGVTLSPRDLRRAHAVALLRLGFSPEAVAEQMGISGPDSMWGYQALAKKQAA